MGFPRLRRRLTVLAVILALPSVADVASNARGVSSGCRLVKVVDGDTATLSCDGAGVVSARLVGFDAPEVFSPQCLDEWIAGQAATAKLRALLWSAEERAFSMRGEDRYGRALVQVRVDGRDVAALMISSGHARSYDGGTRAGWCGRI